jgi:hypothetical protein
LLGLRAEINLMFRLSRYLLLAGAAALAGAATAPPQDASLERAKAIMAALPLRFEANQGQLPPSVRYRAQAGGYRLLLGAEGPSLAFGAHRIDISLDFGNRAPRIEPLDRLATRTDSYIGARENWRTNIPTYSRVRYDAVYPGIDIIYYGSHGQLEYDFTLAPGSDPSAIRMRFRGADALRVDDSGNLIISSGGSEIVQKAPVVYQRDASGARRAVHARYRLLGRNVAGFRVGSYDRSRQLVIDPVLVYCTYFGGPGTDQINAVKFFNGNLYLVGDTDSSVQPPTDGAWANNLQGTVNIFLAIVSTTQNNGNFPITYFSYIGGQLVDIPLALDVDSSGSAYIAGTTTSTNFPLTGNAFQTTGAGSITSSFVAEINPSLYGGVSLVFSSFLSGTTGNDIANGIAVGPNGLIYVVGTATSTDFPVTSNAYQQILWGPSDAFLCQIDPTAGSLLYSTYMGGENDDDGRNILVGANGLVYFSVSTLSKQFPMAGQQIRGIPAGGEDVVVGVMDMSQQGNSSLVYSTFLGGSANEEVRGMQFDSKGNVMITGYTLSSNFPVTPDAVQPTYAGAGDAFVTVINPSIPYGGGLLYSTYLGGSGGDVGYGITADAAGYIYVTGYTLSSNFPIAGTSVPQPNWADGTDLFIAKIDRGVAGSSGLQFSTYLGSDNQYVPCGIAVGPDGNV